MATTNEPAVENEPLGDVPDKPVPEPQAELHARHKHSAGYWLGFALLVLGAALLVIFFGWLPRHRQKEEISRQAQQRQAALPQVDVLRIQRAGPTSELMVPGTTQAYTEANIYARASGYVTRRLADIGDHVRAGQLLAVIDAPDLDKQVSQARASLRQSESTLGQVQAQLHLASLTWDRYQVLVAKGVFSRQDGDTQEANFRVAEANVAAAQNTIQGNRENLDRLIVLQGYERVTAPFDGVVTARNVDVGTLITTQGTGAAGSSAMSLPGTSQAAAEGNNAGSSGNVSSSTTPATGGAQGGPMFTVADTGLFRVLVSVPEAYTSLVMHSQRADLVFQELPAERFTGRVTRTSASIDQNTRTLLVEIQVRNRKNLLMPGMYAQVNMVQTQETPPVMVPGEAIVVRNGSNMVAVVQDNVVHLRPIQVGRDYGNETEVTTGLNPGDIVALNVSDEVRDGGKIEPRFNAQSQPSAPSGKQAGTEGQYGTQNQSNQGGKASQPGKGASGGKGGAAKSSKQ